MGDILKLNNKGFAISSIMYIILVLAVVLIALTLAILSSRKLILDKLKNEVSNNIYEVYPLTYRETLNTLKEEAINYASSNNIEKDSIKISNLESSIDSNTISGYKLNDRYLTMVSNDNTYDVYLGEEEVITDISKPVENLMDIIDYKIYGNSYQETSKQGKNLFDISKVTNASAVTNNGDSLTITSYGAPLNETLSVLCPNLKVGDTVVLNVTPEEGGAAFIAVNGKVWINGETKTITEADLTTTVYVYNVPSAQGDTYGIPKTLSNIQIEYGSTRTEYEAFVPNSPSPKYSSEIESVGDKSSNYADLSKSVVATTTTHVTFNYDNSTGTVELTSTPTTYDYLMIYLQRDLGMDLKVGQTYYYGGDIVVSGKQTTDRTTCTFGLNVVGESPIVYNFYKNETRHIEGTFIYEGQETIRLTLNFNYGSIEPAQVKFENVYISEVGNEYEPYYEGYKIPIEVNSKNLIQYPYGAEKTGWDVQNDGSIIVDVDTGEEEYSMKNFQTNSVIPKGTYYFSLGNDEIESVLLTFYYKDENGNQKWKQVKNNNTITFDSDFEYIKMYLQINPNSSVHGTIYPQLEKGNSATDFSLYAGKQTTNINLDEPLRKIGDYADYIDLKNSKVGRFNRNFNLKISDMNNNEDYPGWRFFEGTEEYNILKTDFPDYNNNLNNKVNYKSNISEEIYAIAVNTKSLSYSVLFFSKEYFGLNQTEWKEQHPDLVFNLVYSSSREIEETIELPKINTGIGTSIISIDTEIEPSSVEFTVIKKIKQI